MDSYEATRVVFSKIQSLDPDNASKIMGFILIQDYGDHEMTRLAFGPESLLHSLVLKAKSHLSLSFPSPPPLTSTSTPSSPSSPSPLNPISRRPIINPHLSSRSASTTSLSYANVVNGTSNNDNANTTPTNNNNALNSDPVDEYHELQAHLSFLNDAKSDDLCDTSSLHRRSYSVPGTTCLWPSSNANNNNEESSFTGLGGWKPCLYFARGFCKNGSSCRFLHGGDSGGDCADTAIVGSPPSNLFGEFEPSRHEYVRPRLAQQQQMQQLMTVVGSSNLPNYGKCMNLVLPLQQNDGQRSTAAELLIGEELQKFRHFRPERNDLLALGLGLGGAISPGSKQIYLTFPADSTFREEDVSNYFSNYGPVQDVRIPYQQKRMFGFVTFVYPETVKRILAKGNPHFVCDSRVLVKPYKEKGKLADRKQQQFMDRGEYSACLSPTGFESRDPFDLPFGSRMGYNTRDMLRKKLEEQADLHHAIELQGRRLMNLQLLDIKNRNRQYPHDIPTGSPISSPVLSCSPNNRSLNLPHNAMNQQVPKESVEASWMPVNSIAALVGGENQALQDVVEKEYTGKRKEENSDLAGECDLHESLEHILPDNLFASPKKSMGENLTVFTNCLSEGDEVTNLTTPFAPNNDLFLPTSSPLNIASLDTCFLQMPSFSSGHGTIGM